jgi:hypothetical protein
MTGRAWEDQHAQQPVDLERFMAKPDDDQKPIRVVTTGYQETAEQVAKLVGSTGAYRFALLWTHPEFPDADRPDVPPDGVAVTWSAIACFDRRADKTAQQLGIDRHLVHAIWGRAVVAASCYGLDYANVIACACAELMRTLGANVGTAGGTPAQLVATPRQAMLEALDG